MKTMVVIDDEILVRMGIKETIDWNAHNIQIIGEATNGRDGLKEIKRLHPDLVISDIKMPLMDGVELVKAIQEAKIDCSVVILSGYKDFDFAKGALENGAVEYLLKPIDNQELVASVLRAAAKLDQRRQLSLKATVLDSELPDLKMKLIKSLIECTPVEDIEGKLTLYNMHIPDSGFLVYGQIDNGELYIDSSLPENALSSLFESLKSDFRKQDILKYDTLYKDNFFFVIDRDNLIENLSILIRNNLDQYGLDFKETVSIGISGPYDGFANLGFSYQRAKNNAMNKLFPGINTLSGDTTQSEQIKPIILKTMDFIAKNYHRNLSVKMVTDALFVSESYLMHLFKENAKKTFNECVADYRILVAQKLLIEQKYKVYEVSEMVGYPDVKYFSQIFKKKTGATPTEYAEKMNGHRQ